MKHEERIMFSSELNGHLVCANRIKSHTFLTVMKVDVFKRAFQRCMAPPGTTASSDTHGIWANSVAPYCVVVLLVRHHCSVAQLARPGEYL